MSHLSFETNKVFASILRFIEIQDTINQLAKLQQKELISFNDLPHFLISALPAQLKQDPSLTFTLQALTDGLPLLINTILEFEHNDRWIGLHILEYLSPLTYKRSDTCYSGPLTRQEFALITCSDTKTVVKADTLTKCYKEENTLLCPANVLTLVRDVA